MSIGTNLVKVIYERNYTMPFINIYFNVDLSFVIGNLNFKCNEEWSIVFCNNIILETEGNSNYCACKKIMYHFFFFSE